MSIKIAICDSEMHILSQLEIILTDILKQMGIEYEIEPFQTGESLCRELERQYFDLIFLDIELPRLGGVEVSKYIREQLKNYIVKIAYLSREDVLAKELCEFVPIGYLAKALEVEEVKKVIERYFRFTEQIKQIFCYKKRTVQYSIPHSEIMYLESDAHRIHIYTVNNEDEFYGTIENVYQQLKNNDFLRIHKSFIVNYHFIKNYGYQVLEMEDGRKLSISRVRQKEIYDRYMQIQKKNK